MKIAYLDINPHWFVEDYSIAPARYGGGSCIAKWMKEFYDDFFILGREENFSHVAGAENKSACIKIDSQIHQQILDGKPIVEVYPEIQNYDIIFSTVRNPDINLDGYRGKRVGWSVGYGEQIPATLKYLFLYNQYQNPQITNEIKIGKIIIGKELKHFVKTKKENFIFQCTRHEEIFSSADVASFARRNKIPAFFAGPVSPEYHDKFFAEIDNQHTMYLGIITEEQKLNFTRRARLYTLLHKWPTPFNLSAIESLQLGTPVVCCHVGFWPSLITEGYNGFYAHNEEQLMAAYQNATKIDQFTCFQTSLPYNQYAMCKSVYDQLLLVHNDK